MKGSLKGGGCWTGGCCCFRYIAGAHRLYSWHTYSRWGSEPVLVLLRVCIE
jgi:hypothetical protein